MSYQWPLPDLELLQVPLELALCVERGVLNVIVLEGGGNDIQHIRPRGKDQGLGGGVVAADLEKIIVPMMIGLHMNLYLNIIIPLAACEPRPPSWWTGCP